MESIEITLEFKAESEADEKIFNYLLSSSDYIVYNGKIEPYFDKPLITMMKERIQSKNITFFLTTPGGDPDSAFRLSRFFQTQYDNFTLAVLGECKSAGTLLALGADEIIMSPQGEFGPLDVQLFRPDEFLQRTSGLTISQALSFIGDKAFDTFEKIFLDLRGKSGGVITTTTAAKIASEIVTGIYSPITEKIDPMRIGEMQRSMDIALHYGIRLGANEKVVRHLAGNYPSHSFVIDFEESKDLFNCVRVPNIPEQSLITQVQNVSLKEFNIDPFFSHRKEAILLFIKIKKYEEEEKESIKLESDNESKKQNQENKDQITRKSTHTPKPRTTKTKKAKPTNKKEGEGSKK